VRLTNARQFHYKIVLHFKLKKSFFVSVVFNFVVETSIQFFDCSLCIKAYFETRTELGLEPRLGLQENADSRKTQARTRTKSGLVFEKTRIWLLTITTHTMCEVIKSGGVRYYGTAEPSVGSVDRHKCTNCINEQVDLIFYTSRTSNINI
jgi:hypothetical protein